MYRQIRKMNILVYNTTLLSGNGVLQSDDINIMLIVNLYNSFILKGKKDESLRTIIQNGHPAINIDLDQFEFIYKNKQINLNERFEDIADIYDKKIMD